MSWPGTCKQRKPRSSEEDRYDGAVDGLEFRRENQLSLGKYPVIYHGF